MRPSTRLLGSLVTSALLVATLPAQAVASSAGPVVIPVGTGPAVVPAFHGAGQEGRPRTHPRAWARPDPTVAAPATAVVAEVAPRAGSRRALRVVTLRDVGGEPRVSVAPVRGREAAVEAVEDAQDRSGVVAVSVDTRVRAAGLPSAALTGSDPLRPQQWGLDLLAAESAWATATGDGVVVAVVDSGVDGRHPDLAARLTPQGHDFVTDAGDGRIDENSHGTHVAGVVAAVQGNSLGVAGLAPRARIMPVRVLDAEGAGWSSDIAAGITYAVDHGADVVNLSLGGPYADPVTERAVGYALSRGVAVVAAVGNERSSGSPRTYPAAYPGVIAVAAVDQSGASSAFSSVGDYVDVAAPGRGILSTVVGSYGFSSGTSMAAPFVSATAALALDATDGSATVTELERAITSTATDIGVTGWDPESGHGVVSPVAALGRLLAAAPALQPTVTSPDPSATPAPASAPAEDPPAQTLPAPDPTPEPGTEPAQPDDPVSADPVEREVVPTFTSPGGRVPAGARRTLSLAVTDAAGAPVADHRVVVLARRGGGVVDRRAAVTGADGGATVTVRVPRTTRFVLRVPATVTTAAAAGDGSVTWRAFARVRARHAGASATVRVLRPAGQRVRFEQMTQSGWVRVAVRQLDGRGRVVVRGLPQGRLRAVVTRVPGLLPVRTRSWTVG